MTHPIIESYADYFAVLARSDDNPSKDERFITRAFATLGFDDQESGDEGIQFRHEESGVIVTCDGDVITIYNVQDETDDVIKTIYSDLFLAVQRIGWTAASLYCAKGGEQVLEDMAAHVPASFDSFRIVLSQVEPTDGEVDEIRNLVVSHSALPPEPTFVIGELAADRVATDEVAEPLVAIAPLVAEDLEQVSALEDLIPPRSEQAQQVQEHATPAAGQISEAQPPTTHKPQHVLSQSTLERQLVAREREVADLHQMIKQILSGKSMEQFAASVLPHDAIVIAHLYAPAVGMLELMGFERVFNVYTNEDYGVTFDGAFMVFTKDVAGPEWIETLLARLGGTVLRVWQSQTSLVGALLAQYGDGGGLVAPKPVPAQRPDAVAYRSPTVSGEGNMSSGEDRPTSDQQRIADALADTFRSVLNEVFKAQNATSKVAERVSQLEVTGLSLATKSEAHI